MTADKEVLDVIEEALDASDKLIQRAEELDDYWLLFLKKDKKKVIIAGVLMASGIALASGTTGWLLAEKKLKTKYEELAEKDIREAKEFYAAINKEGYETPAAAMEKLHGESVRPEVQEAADALLRYKGGAEGEEDREPDVQVTNVFTDATVRDGDFDYEEELKNRTPESPYIIHHDEFMQAEPGYEQVTLTYYEGDDTLSDEKDEAIPIVDEIVGEENLLRFGHGSHDPRTVYIRNEKLSLDFEVTKSDGKFAHEVLGLQHSDVPFERMPRPSKMRGGDE